MKSEKDILLEKMNKALQKKDYVKVTQIKTQLDKLNQYELIPVKDLFGQMTKDQKEKAVYICKKNPLFADLLSQAAIELTNIIQQVDPSSNLVLMKDLSKARFYAERVVKIVDDLNDDEFSESFGEFADKVNAEIDNLFERYGNK